VILLAKVFEAIGIASVLLGLVQGIQTNDMWAELYLSLLGIALFVLGWGIEKVVARGAKKGGAEQL
jgi:hypothetical protein